MKYQPLTALLLSAFVGFLDALVDDCQVLPADEQSFMQSMPRRSWAGQDLQEQTPAAPLTRKTGSPQRAQGTPSAEATHVDGSPRIPHSVASNELAHNAARATPSAELSQKAGSPQRPKSLPSMQLASKVESGARHGWRSAASWFLGCWWAAPSLWLAFVACLAVVQLWAIKASVQPWGNTHGASNVLLGSNNNKSVDTTEHSGALPCLVRTVAEDFQSAASDLERSWQLETAKRGPGQSSLARALFWQSESCLGFLLSMIIFLLAALAGAASTALPALGLELLLGQLENIGRLGIPEGPWDGVLLVAVCVGFPLLTAALEVLFKARASHTAARTIAALAKLLMQKAARLPAQPSGEGPGRFGSAECLACMESVGEALPWTRTCALAAVQAAVLMRLLWITIGPVVLITPLSLALIFWISTGHLRGLVPAYVAYEDAARQRRELLPALAQDRSTFACGEEEDGVGMENKLESVSKLRQEETRALWTIQSTSHRAALLTTRGQSLLPVVLMVIAASMSDSLQLAGPKAVFPAFILLHGLIQQLSNFGTGLTKLLRAKPALARLEAFLTCPELSQDNSCDLEASHSLRMSGSFSWGQEQVTEPAALLGIDLTVHTGSLVAVVGTSGAGKSSLLQAAAGGLWQLPGSMLNRPTTASSVWLPSEVKLFSGSLCDNVLCGRALEPERYGKVIEAAGLSQEIQSLGLEATPDLNSDASPQLPASLQARISLARAAYGNEDLVLLDEPLGGGPPDWIKMLQGPLLQGRTRIVAVGSESALPADNLKSFDRVLILQGGVIVADGAPSQVMGCEAFQHVQSCWAPAARLPTKKQVSDRDLRQCSSLREEHSGKKDAVCHQSTLCSFSGFFGLAGSCKVSAFVCLALANQVCQVLFDWGVMQQVCFTTEGQYLNIQTGYVRALAVASLLLCLAVAVALPGCGVAAAEVFHCRYLSALAKAPLDKAGVHAALQHLTTDLRQVDLGLFHQVWALLAAVSNITCIVAMIHAYLGLAGFLLLPSYIAAVALFRIAVSARPNLLLELDLGRTQLRNSLSNAFLAGHGSLVQPGAERLATLHDTELASYVHGHAASNLPGQWLHWRLTVCLSVVYMLAVLLLMVDRSSSFRPSELGLVLTPCALLLQSLRPCVDMLTSAQEEQSSSRRLFAALQRVEAIHLKAHAGCVQDK